MNVIHRTIDCGIGKLGHADQLVDIGKAVFFGNVEVFAYLVAAKFVRIGNADDFKHVGIGFRQLGIDHRAVTAADNDGFKRFVSVQF